MGLLRKILLALLFSLVFGFALGTLLRLRLERPVWYLSENFVSGTEVPEGSPSGSDRPHA